MIDRKLVEACAATGTHYSDVTGEPHFIVEIIERFNATAIQNKARIVPCCGYDSIPADMGILMVGLSPTELFFYV
jgi:short subunit dehydrogenase-like uncharacterized protein